MDPARPPATGADGSGAMFDRIAPRYDLLNRLTSFGLDQGWRRRLMARVAVTGRARILDLATGTADVAIAAALAYPEAEVVGLDPSERMLAIGREKIAARGLTARVSLVVGDAQALPFPDASFDGISMAFGIRNVPDRPRALAEMKRVTRPGGHVSILELTEPQRGPMAPLARLHVHVIVPLLGRLLSGPAEYSYLRHSIAAFPTAERFAAVMGEAGLTDVTVDRLAFGAAHVFTGMA
jgi:demethylmenaquinone methyltransferase/2-methoxy-6-polyprenyl-1,4-benzoquinol methylase